MSVRTRRANAAYGVADDAVVKVLKQTVFSAFFCAFIPVVIAGHAKSWTQPAVYWSMVWAGFLALSSEFLQYYPLPLGRYI